MGRLSKYTDEVAEIILERLMYGEGLNTICRAEGIPPESTVREWVVDDREGFAAKYARAREIGMDAAADRLRDLARTAKGEDAAGVSAVALMVNTEKWYLSKIAPKKYGEKLDVTSDGKAMPTVTIVRPSKDGEAIT
jgi:hypothetical protein